jgi:steroid delta-isomerase-like uncharacterized protein
MRRLSVLLSVSVVLVLGIMAVGFAPRAHPQETTPVASPAALLPLLQQWVDGVNTGGGDAVAALYAEDGVHEDIPSGMVASGRQEIADLVTGALNQFDDLRWEPVSARQVGDLAVLEYAFSATDREIGKPVSFRGVIVFELDGDEIHRSADYYDVATILGELGLLDMGEESAAATPVP